MSIQNQWLKLHANELKFKVKKPKVKLKIEIHQIEIQKFEILKTGVEFYKFKLIKKWLYKFNPQVAQKILKFNLTLFYPGWGGGKYAPDPFFCSNSA